MDERFVSLAAFLRAAPPAAAMPAPPVAVAGVIDFAHADLVHELALMRLATIEAYERAAQRLLRLLASDVLGRELMLAPVDLDALVATALATFAESEPVTIAVSAADLDRVRVPLPLRLDPALAAGDLVVDVRDGTIEAHFTFRLESALERAEHAS